MAEPFRLGGLALAASLIAATPALAQTEAEVIGTYRMKVEPAPGSLCPPGEAEFQVLRIGGQLVEVSLDHTTTIADWNAQARTFHGTIPFPDGDHLIQMDGSFSRGPDRVNLVVMVKFPPDRPCEALLSGSIPAAAVEAAPPPVSPPPPMSTTPSPTGPPIFGVAPNGDPVDLSRYNQATGPRSFSNGAILGGGAVAVVLSWVLMGMMSGKRKPAPATPAAPPAESAPPAPPKPVTRPKAKPKPALTEEEDELGDG